VTRYLHLRTGRLCLDAVTRGDLYQLHELHADPEVWRHLPSGRHGTREHTAAYIADIERDWATVGLGYWAIRPGGHLDDGVPAAAPIGIGGCAVRHDAMWNLYYRLTPAAQGRGFAAETVTAAGPPRRTCGPICSRSSPGASGQPCCCLLSYRRECCEFKYRWRDEGG